MVARNRKVKVTQRNSSKRKVLASTPGSHNIDNKSYYTRILFRIFLISTVLCFVVFYFGYSRKNDADGRGGGTNDADHRRENFSAQNRKSSNKVKPKNISIQPKSNSPPSFKATIHPQISMKNMTINGRVLTVTELPHQNNIKTSVRLYQIDNFLTKEECNGLSYSHHTFVKKSNDVGPLFCFASIETFRKYLKEAGLSDNVSEQDFVRGTTCTNETFSQKLREKFKWSVSTAFYSGESKFSLYYEKRIEDISGLLRSHGGKFQVTSYPQNIGYKSHTDCTVNSGELRDRYATALVYLQDVKRGGETIFTKLGIKVQPKQGRLIIWNNMNKQGECDPTSVHEAARVLEGRKYILQRWYYFKNFPTLGYRGPEPELPHRKDNQPLVTCDVFEEGSCRWYDEWSYDHLTAYMENKNNLK